MKRRCLLCALAALFLLAACRSVAQAPASDPVLAAMRQELDRSLLTLKKQAVPPYFLSYQVTDNHAFQIHSAFGVLTGSQETRTRDLDIDLRAGDYALDNTHPLRSGTWSFGFRGRFGRTPMPIEDDPAALRAAIWIETDKSYKQATERLAEVKANVQVKVEGEDKSPDFSREAPERFYEPEPAFALDRLLWEDKLRRYTAPFSKYPDLYEAGATLIAEVETRRYVNSDGSEVRTSTPFYRLLISASSKAEDGMELPLYESFMAFRPEAMPDDATVLKTVEVMIQKLIALRKAPLAEPYTGPAILSGRASAVFFHEIFGHRVEGHRQKDEEEAQTFKKRINQPVLPETFSIYSDPTLTRLGDTDLVGFYRYDDEGVKAQRVAVVEKGVLKNFLMSRSPVEGFTRSNGHGRRQQGFAVAARQSNLVIESSRRVSRAELKRMLIEQVKTAKKPYGLLFEDIEGGFTFTMRVLPNAFNVMPTEVYRIYPDGREELVRGVDLIGTPLIAFSKIVAADSEVGVFNGMCGAESGSVPVSAVSPGILVTQIEVQRKEKSQERPPLLPSPAAGGDTK